MLVRPEFIKCKNCNHDECEEIAVTHDTYRVLYECEDCGVIESFRIDLEGKLKDL